MSIGVQHVDVTARYATKIKNFCSDVDPYRLDLKQCVDPLPNNVGFFDIVNYCVNKDSPYTNESFKAYKALDAFKYYENGWVKKLFCKKQSNGFIIIARVSHSQRMREKPSSCWVSVDLSGIILCGHCSCMAGLGEVCTHIGATLFLLSDWCRKYSELHLSNISCTDVLAKWVVQPNKDADMAKAKDIKWSNKAAIERCIHPLPSLTNTEIDDLLTKMRVKAPCVLMAMRPPFSDKFIPSTPTDKICELQSDVDEENEDVRNLMLMSLYDHEFRGMSLKELNTYTDEVDLWYTDEDIFYIEKKTRLQRKSKLWFRFRTGRVTVSTFKSVCRSRTDPSISLIKKICYPEQCVFTSKATQYGIDNEDIARQCYLEMMQEEHIDFSVEESGLVINNEFPHCGVSPDGVTNCACCGRGSLEIKCPLTLSNNNMMLYLQRKDCPLYEIDSDYFLKSDHEYYYQVQIQMFVLDVEFCDFVVWNSKSTTSIRVFKNEDFWYEEYTKCESYWRKVILPELMGCYYTDLRDAQVRKQEELAKQRDNAF